MVIETLDITNKNGGQAIRIPKKMRINDDKVYLKKWVIHSTLSPITTHGKI